MSHRHAGCGAGTPSDPALRAELGALYRGRRRLSVTTRARLSRVGQLFVFAVLLAALLAAAAFVAYRGGRVKPAGILCHAQISTCVDYIIDEAL